MPGLIPAARLELVPLAVAHAEEMAGVLADPALHRFIGGVPPDLDALRARYARQSAGSPDPAVLWGNWVLRPRATGRLVGTVQATVEDGVAEVAWVIGTAWQGHGYATEAARALVARLTEPVGAAAVHTVVAHIHPDHRASAAVAAACGLAPTREAVDGEVRWRLRAAPRAGG
ncbi:GNAT family N-acetyltransferase [Streptomyces sp. NPDC006529]|uniref:GNAT family N-acetyltransferase n=1 Tax=Streptomyces sp. NPDC006529 TaxID=3157177 RepID=UPI0033B2C2AF